MTDLIRRAAAIDALVKDCKASDEGMLNMYDIVCDLKDVPSAQPERKKGKWIHDRLCTTNGNTYGVRRCSLCEAYYHDIDCGWNFCPNCGARME